MRPTANAGISTTPPRRTVPSDDVAELTLRIDFAVSTIPIGGLRDEQVCPFEHARRTHEGVIDAAEIASEADSVSSDIDIDAHRAQNVTGSKESRAHRTDQRDIVSRRHRDEAIESGQCVIDRIQRARLFVAGPTMSRCVARLLFHQMRAVQEHDPTQGDGALAREDMSAESVTYECRKVARVVEMGMGEKHGVDGVRRHRKRRAVATTQYLEAL